MGDKETKNCSSTSTETEYILLSQSSREIVNLRQLVGKLCFFHDCDGATTIYNDNQSAHKLIENSSHHGRSKHIDIRYHFVRNLYQTNQINVKYVPTHEMTADALTKSVPKVKYNFCVKEFGLVNNFCK